MDLKVELLQPSEGAPVTPCDKEQKLLRFLYRVLLEDLPEPLDVLIVVLASYVASRLLQLSNIYGFNSFDQVQDFLAVEELRKDSLTWMDSWEMTL
jgi:hypothetical protein